MPRPELGKPQVGDPVIVIDGNHRQRMSASEMVIVKVGRQWVTVAPKSTDGRPRTRRERRFRIDTQRGGSAYGYDGYFCTPEQRAWDQQVAAADVYLREVAGLDVRHDGPFHLDPDLRLALAKLLKDAEASWRPPAPE